MASAGLRRKRLTNVVVLSMVTSAGAEGRGLEHVVSHRNTAVSGRRGDGCGKHRCSAERRQRGRRRYGGPAPRCAPMTSCDSLFSCLGSPRPVRRAAAAGTRGAISPSISSGSSRHCMFRIPLTCRSRLVLTHEPAFHRARWGAGETCHSLGAPSVRRGYQSRMSVAVVSAE